MRIALVLVALAGCCAKEVQATGPGFDETWRWAHFTMDSGLPSDNVLRIAEAANGDVWAATEAGLAFYDGFQWHVVGRDRLQDVRNLTLHPGKGDTMWVVSSGRLYRCNGHRIQREHFQHDEWELRVGSVVPLADGTLLVAARSDPATGFRLFRITDNGSREEDSPLDDLDESFGTVGLWRTNSGRIWLSTATGVFVFNQGRWETWLTANSPEFRVNYVGESEDGCGLIYVSAPFDARSIWQWAQKSTKTLTRREGYGAVVAISMSPDGTIVVRHGSGLVWVRSHNVWSVLDPPVWTLASANALTYGANGDLWVASPQGVFLFRASLNRWNYPEGDPHVVNRKISDLLLAQDGSVWSTERGALRRFLPDGSVETVDRIFDVPLWGLAAVQQDSGGNIWLSGGFQHHGAFRWDGTEWTHFHEANGFDVDLVHRIAKDRRGRLWFLCLDDLASGVVPTGPGVFVEENGVLVRWPHSDELLSGRVYSFVESEDGAKWFGTYAGLSRFQDGTWRHWTEDDGIRGGTVFTMALAVDGTVWFGNRGHGLGRVTPAGEIRYVTEADGFIDDEVWDTKFDSLGRLWVSTCGGICRYDGESWRFFSVDSGLRNPCIWPILPLEDRVILGTLGSGVAMLRLDEESTPPPRVELHQPKFDGDDTHLSWNVFPFRSDPRVNGVSNRWKIDDGPWSSWTTSRSATVTGLEVGMHLIQVEAQGMFGNRSAAGERMEFSMPAAPYRSLLIYGASASVVIFASMAGVLLLRRKREKALRVSANQLSALAQEQQLLLDHTRDFLYRHNLEGNFEYLSPSVEQITGYEVGHFANHYREYMTDHPLNRQVVEITRQTLKTGRESPTYLLQIRHKAGNLITLEINERPYFEEGRVAGIIGVARDVTERVRAETQLREAKDAAEAASRTKSEFLANVSHEIRTPIMAMLGAAELSGLVSEAGKSALDTREIILRNGRHLLSLINEVLDAAHHEAGFLPVLTSSCCLMDLVEDIVAAVSPFRRDADVDFRVRLDSHVPATITTDRTRLTQAVINLINNGLKFTERGHVHVGIRCDRADSDHCMLQFTVDDSGPGISEESIESIFETFVQLPHSSGTVGRGVGLGLPLARQIAQKLEGSLDVTSKVGLGSTFVLNIPVKTTGDEWISPEDFDSLRADLEHPLQTNGKRLRGRVLLAEDYADTRLMMERALSDVGVEVVTACDGKEALEHARQHEFDLVLMDVRMPEMDGVEATQELRKRGCAMPIVALTASTEPRERKRLLAMGFDEFWPKPISLKRLVDRASAFLPPDSVENQPGSAADPPRETSVASVKLREAQQRYARLLPGRCDNVRKAVEESDLAAAAELLHQLVGSAGIHGFDEISEMAARLLNSARSGELQPDSSDLRAMTRAAEGCARNPQEFVK